MTRYKLVNGKKIKFTDAEEKIRDDEEKKAEKDRLEAQVKRLGQSGLQRSLAQKMLPQIRKIEQKRIASYRAKKR